MELKGRSISKGIIEGIAIVSKKPFSFLGGVDEEGNIIDKDSDLYGQSLKGKIFVFPYGRGSTVGSYVIYGLAKRGILKGIVNKECEPIVATGAILGGIPLVDKIDIEEIKTGDRIVVDGNTGVVKILNK
ncbi:TPA: DUF126 domain-containing protein [Methanocaldococcus jannaschii]|uniref:Phosphomevalonate dehydratase small subunit n=2 Tax=Methanocaldococcus jannaschii TaxID=2190 RepID=PMDHS_METJA|nr:DUF126 domain-containing protein [Methanocaldococcus jannaschii]Q58802.1 RecName: Full=UPF0107 protein MJ1407 [Methanocaldococcus jannaschii DSM 2661]AAB99415.1 conserved hypothetical protein [Methanocaldococcus jannaschii DSM 2661]HII59752.1 DUF126 domain-containing protein [Methanocaldococcus jannaschii]